MKIAYIVSLVLIIAAFVISVYVYPAAPDEVPSHWNAKGEVDGYMSKFWGLFILPIIMSLLFPLFLILPKIDPLKKNVMKFINYFHGLIIVLFCFFFYIHVLIIFASFGTIFNMTVMIMPALGLMFYFIGIVTENAKQNWFIGIRTPWTLSNEKVWNKTHKLGGKLLKLMALLAIIGIFFGEWGIWLFIVPVLALSFYLVAYSYFEYQKETKK